ncbi:outer membrane lipoprotein LolB [Xylophilus sp. Kf1]|nr:outer membrane lipoprotein LolB [Xylophilus sp. Kf1]
MCGTAVLCLAGVVSGCASPRPAQTAQAAAATAQQEERWSGRLALQVEDAPSQSFYASFELTGDARAGTLSLTTPIGSTVAVLRWTPDGASLQQGSQPAQRFSSLDELAERATGTAIPVASLFDWLAGRPGQVPGWIADLSAQPDGRIVATRQQPLPVATLRVVLDR